MIKVFFIAKIKNLNKDYHKYSEKLWSIAETLPGFIDITSQEIDDVEITISSWKTKQDVENWSRHPIHIEAKKRSLEWYHWIKGIHVEAVDD